MKAFPKNSVSVPVMPNIDWCEKCTWDEVHRECAKNEELELELKNLKIKNIKRDAGDLINLLKSEGHKQDMKDFKAEELLLKEIEDLKEEIAELRAGMSP